MRTLEKFIFDRIERKAKRKFVAIQDDFIEQIKADANTWQKLILHSEKMYGYDQNANKFFDAFAFYRLSFLDIAMLFKMMLSAKADVEKKMLCKYLALNIYEFIYGAASV